MPRQQLKSIYFLPYLSKKIKPKHNKYLKQLMQVKNRDEEQISLVYEEKINSFISYLEIGDFATSALILYGFVLYGMTRIGKTATAHLLAGNPLKGIKKDGHEMVDTTTNRNNKAKIGNSSNSQTVVPNKFELKNYKIDDTPAFIIDTPGYGDTDGILKILANGYFHYRLYSKIQNMKFIVCFDSDDLKKTAKDVIQTIISFTKSFDNYPQVKNNIWKSCCFLVTKVDSNHDSLQTIKQKFQSLVDTLKTKEKPEVQKLIKQFIQNMIDGDKIFVIKKYKNGESSNDGHLLQKIDKKVSTWWSRKTNPAKPDQVDMNDVMFALGKDVVVQTTKNQVSQEQFAELVKTYNLRIRELFANKNSSMKRILTELVNDAMGSPDSHNFLKIMSQQVEKFYPKPKKDQKEDIYNEDREKVLRKLFQPVCNLSSSRKTKDTKSLISKFKSKNYPLKKMYALQKIQELMTVLNDKQYLDRDISWLEECQLILFQIIKQLSKVSYNKNDKKNIIYRYGYIISRVIEEAKIFVLLLEKFSTNKIKQDIKSKSNEEVIDVFRPLKDFMGVSFYFEEKYLDYEELHKIYIQRFDPENELNKNLEITEEFADFFDKVEAQDDQTKIKIAKIVLKYSTSILNDKTRTISNEQKSRLVKKLSNSLTICHELYELSPQMQEKKKVLAIIRKLSKNLGRILEDLKQYELSRQVYDSVYFVNSVCKIYRKEIDEMDMSQQNSLQNRLAFCKYLMSHSRDSDAVKLLQQSFEVVEQAEDLEEIRKQFSELMIVIKGKKQQGPNQYESNILAEVYFQKLKQQTVQKLNALYKINKKDKKANSPPQTSEQINGEEHFQDVQSQSN